MFPSFKFLWPRGSVTENLLKTLEEEEFTRPESPPPNFIKGERFYQDIGWLKQSHKSRRALLAEIGNYPKTREFQNPRFERHIYRSLALQGDAASNFKNGKLKSDIQTFLIREKQDAANILRRSKEFTEVGNFYGALNLCFEARDILQNLGESDASALGETCQFAFLSLLKTKEIKTAIEFLGQYPSMFKKVRTYRDELRVEIEQLLTDEILEIGPKVVLRGVLNQLLPNNKPEMTPIPAAHTPSTFTQRSGYAQRVEQASLPDDVRHKAQQAVEDIRRGAGEDRYRLEKWLETVLQYPFSRVSPAVGDINQQVKQVKIAMRERVTGHQEAKEAILDFVHQRASTTSARSNIIGLQGPPGNGKSTLLESLKVGLGIPYCEANLNGMGNSGILFGVPKGIVGAGPGLFVQEIIRQGCASPMFLLEEVDKVSDGQGGCEVIHKLMALTDSLDSRHLVDDFLEGIRLSCPQSLIIFTFNNLEKIDPVLRSRIQIIRTEPLSETDKKAVFDKHMLPRIAKSHGFDADTLKFAKSARNALLRKYAQEGQMKQLSLELNTIIARASRGRSSGRFGNTVYVRASQGHVVVSRDPS